MTRIPLTFLCAVFPWPAFAHVGHVGELAGHDHWVIGAALGAAIAAGIWGALKGKDDTKTEDEPELQEA